jgi:hypothetical protein
MGQNLGWGFVMALCISLVPNLAQAIVHVNDIERSPAGKAFTIFLIGAGAAVTSAVLAHRKVNAGDRVAITIRLSLLLLAGIAASAYFISVIGLPAQGLGAGLGELLDSGLSPCFYMVLAVLLGDTLKGWFASATGTALILIGLLSMGFSPIIQSELGQLRLIDGQNVLILYGVMGALGTAISSRLIQGLVKDYKVDRLVAVAVRYTGASFAFLVLALHLFTAEGNVRIPNWSSGLIAFFGGGLLINGAYFALLRIDRGTPTAAAMALIPLVTFGLEAVLNAIGLNNSRLLFGEPTLWLGITIATAGITVLTLADQKDHLLIKKSA